jgi:hypothetical protein
MASVAREPRPSVVRAFVTSLLRLRLGDAGTTVRTAWRLAFQRARPVVPLVRLQSLVLIVLLGVLLGAGGVLAAGGTLRVIEEIRNAQDAPRGAETEVATPRSSLPPSGVERGIVAPTGGGEPGRQERQQDGTERGSQDGAGDESGARDGSGAWNQGREPESRQRQQDARTAPPARDGSGQEEAARREASGPGSRRSEASPRPAQGSGPAQPSPGRDRRAGG